MLVALEVYNPAGALVFEQSYDTQTFAAGERRAYAVDWTVPPTEPLGAHTVRVGVFSPGWGTVLHWNANAAAFTVTAAGPPPPIGFREEVAFAGLTNPTQLSFAADGRIFVAEKSGLIKVFDDLADTTPTVFADLRTNVHNFWDRGLLGMELDPDFPAQPYVYVLYTHDAAIGGTAPRWGTAGATSDGCPTPPGSTDDGCVVSGRLSRLQANGNVMTGPEHVLIDDWCQQYPSHSMGTIEFGADGALYVTAGDGASFNFVDYGQDGNPVNPCGDAPGGPGAILTPPTAEGGALRSQDLRTSGDPAALNGALVRVDPATGAGLPDNPGAASADPNVRRIVAHGLRNPFRFTIRPGTNEVWIGDVGWDIHEEINRVVNPTDAVVENFGWPCWEGNGHQPGYDALDLNICEGLYSQAGSMTSPYYSYAHVSQVVPGETCPLGSSSLAGIAFYTGGEYPASYDGALFFADYSRDCIWVMFPGANGLPNPATVAGFVTPATNPVDIQISPEGELFYVDFDGGTIRRIRYFDGNQPPTAVAGASATYGPAPLTVDFSATGSSDPDVGDTLSYAWDLDGDGAYDDSTSASTSRTYPPGNVTVGLRVTDSKGLSHTDSVVISAGNTPPVATIDVTRGVAELEGRRCRLVLGLGDRPGGGWARGLAPFVVADHAPLSVELPLPCAADVRWCEQWLVHRARPRVPVAPRVAVDGDRRQRTDRHEERAPATPDRGPDVPVGAVGPADRGGADGTAGAVHADRDRGFERLGDGDVASDRGQYDLRVLSVVRRRREDAQRDRTGNRVDVHGDLRPDLDVLVCHGRDQRTA